MLRRLIVTAKRFVPPKLWNQLRNLYNKGRYKLMWQRRRVVTFQHHGAPISLVVVDPTDIIQAEQANGRFYEEEDLAAIAPFIKRGDVFVDIGANTGQHSIFAAKILGAGKIILMEPIPEAYKIILENIRVNKLESIANTSHLGIGLSDKDGRASFQSTYYNLGATELSEDSKGTLVTSTGDALLKNDRVNFIKIDTEGFEIKVLHGLTQTIAREKPSIFIEVDRDNIDAFNKFIDDVDYRIAFTKKRYAANENFMIVPNGR